MFDWLRSKVRRADSLRHAPFDLAAALQRSSQLSDSERGAALGEFEQGNLQRENKQFEAAEQHYRRALTLHPAFAEATANLGSLLKDQGALTEAEQYLAFAIALNPKLGPAYFNLAMMQIDRARWVEAANLLRGLLAFAPAEADAHYWLGNALTGTGDLIGARKAYQAAVRLRPGYVQARWGYVMAQLPVVASTPAEQTQACLVFAHELALLGAKMLGTYSASGHQAVGAQQPYFLAYIASNHKAILSIYGDLCAKLMAAWSKKLGMPAPSVAHSGKCRLGIVSAHIHDHSVWNALVRGWVEHLNARDFEIQIFHTGRGRDAETEWAAQTVHQLHYGLGHWTEWAKAVSNAKLDVLIFPEIGMDATTIRLSALRLARVQLGSWGHPITTGLPTFDAYISAEAFEPLGAEQHYREKLLSLPRLGCCYSALGAVPAKVDFSGLDIGATERILLCAGTSFKYAPQYDAMLVDIARRCQPCKLVFFRNRAPALSDLLEQRLRVAFQAEGVDFDGTVVFIPWQSQSAFFAILNRADVYIDTPGFSGFNTVMQAIECATAIVAFEGEFMRGRFASGVLRQMGLDAWIADSPVLYAQLVERLVCDVSARNELKQQIRNRRARLFGDQDTVAVLSEHLLRLCK